MASTCRSEFQWIHLTFYFKNPSAFVVSRWERGDLVSNRFLIYRISFALWHLGVLIYSLAYAYCCSPTEFLTDTNGNYIQYWPLYLTNLGYTILTIHSILAAAAVIVERIRQPKMLDRMTTLIRISWLFDNVGSAVGLLITIIYWSIIYEKGKVESAESILKHAMNSLLILIDIFVSATPCRLLHFYQPLSAILFYSIFGAVYWSFNGTDENGNDYIYKAFDFSMFEKTWPRMLLTILSAIPIFAFKWSLHWLRDWIRQRFYLPKDRVPPMYFVNQGLEMDAQS